MFALYILPRSSVPVMNNFEDELAELLNGMNADQFEGKTPVAVVVFHDGTELHFFQFMESDYNIDKAAPIARLLIYKNRICL